MSFKDTLSNYMITEANLNAFYHAYKELVSPSQMQKIHDVSLPESNKSNEAMDLILRHIKSNPSHLSGLTGEDSESNLPEISRNLIHSHGYLKTLNIPSVKKHLRQYNDLGDLFRSVDRYVDSSTGEVLPEFQKSKEHQKGTQKIFEDDDVIITRHNTQKSMEKAALLHPQNEYYYTLTRPGKAAWCVSLEGAPGLGHYNHYSDNGKYPFYTVETKDDNHRKFAVDANEAHIGAEEESIWNEPDSPISIGELHATAPSIFKNHELGNYFRKFPYGKILSDSNPETVLDAINNNTLGVENSFKLVKSKLLTPDHLRDIISNTKNNKEYAEYNRSQLVRHALANENINSDVLHHALKHMIYYGSDYSDANDIGDAIVDSPAFNKSHIDYITNELSPDMQDHFFANSNILIHPDITENHLNLFLNSDNNLSRHAAKFSKNVKKAFMFHPAITIMNNPYVTDEFLHQAVNEALKEKEPLQSRVLSGSDRLNETDSHRILDAYPDLYENFAIKSKHLSIQQRVLDSPKASTHGLLLSNPNVHQHIIDQIADHIKHHDNFNRFLNMTIQPRKEIRASIIAKIKDPDLRDRLSERWNSQRIYI